MEVKTLMQIKWMKLKRTKLLEHKSNGELTSRHERNMMNDTKMNQTTQNQRKFEEKLTWTISMLMIPNDSLKPPCIGLVLNLIEWLVEAMDNGGQREVVRISWLQGVTWGVWRVIS